MARNDPQVNFRLPQDLRDRLEDAAKENKRTLTAEIVVRLEDSFAAPLSKQDLSDEASALLRQLHELLRVSKY